jgi:DNA-binding NarL/FixJ family response regulator
VPWRSYGRPDSGPQPRLLSSERECAAATDPAVLFQLRCLIVDNSSPFLVAARSWLERQGITVVGVASTAARALQQAAELHPDIVLVDIDLGDESGFDLANQLHQNAGVNSSRVILISAYVEEDYIELIAARPAVGLLSKTALSAQSIRALVDDGAGGRV